MLIVMDQNASLEHIDAVVNRIKAMNLTPHVIPGAMRVAIGITGNTSPIDPGLLVSMQGVRDAIPVSRPYKLVSREAKNEDSIIHVGSVPIGGEGAIVIAGPCAVESEEQAMKIAGEVKAAGASIFRGGAFKPRTSPYSFQGLGEEGLRILARVRDHFDIPVVTEAIDPQNMDLVEEFTDMIQIGARNMQNFSLLKRAGRAHKPVLLKRGMSATIEELLMSAEYIISEGNYNVVLCERGVRTFSDHTRNTLDLSAVPAVKKLSHLPIIIDPSHGTGRRDKVPPLSKAALAVGADGVMVEVHHEPEKALSDGPQSLLPDQFKTLMGELSSMADVLGRHMV